MTVYQDLQYGERKQANLLHSIENGILTTWSLKFALSVARNNKYRMPIVRSTALKREKNPTC